MKKTDPRTVATDQALLAAVLELAASKPVDLLTTSEVCDRAGVSRTSFYRRTNRASEILVDHFAVALRDRRNRFVTTDTDDAVVLLDLNRTLSRSFHLHLVEHSDIYAHSMALETSVLRQLLRRHLLDSWMGYMELHRNRISLPAPFTDQQWEDARELLGHQYAYGHLGLVEAWLRTHDRDPQVLSELWLNLSPLWSQQLMGLQPRP